MAMKTIAASDFVICQARPAGRFQRVKGMRPVELLRIFRRQFRPHQGQRNLQHDAETKQIKRHQHERRQVEEARNPAKRFRFPNMQRLGGEHQRAGERANPHRPFGAEGRGARPEHAQGKHARNRRRDVRDDVVDAGKNALVIVEQRHQPDAEQKRRQRGQPANQNQPVFRRLPGGNGDTNRS